MDFVRCQALNNIPSKKLEDCLSSIEISKDSQDIKMIKMIAINRYAESNIPLDYWNFSMTKDFVGDPNLKQRYDEYVADIKASYINGSSLLLAGQYGVGKTSFSTSVLKKAAQKNYSCLYTTLSDIVSVITQGSSSDKFSAKRELAMVDFLVLDELDPRYLSSESSADLFARSLEVVFRARSQNKLPTLLCTNSPNVVESFTGSLKASLDSLMRGHLKVLVVSGSDFRKTKGKQ